MKHTTMYLSVRQARGWDGPVGDPFGGPAYGKREMPVIAVVAAVGSFAAGAAAVAAGTATFMTGVMMVGAALTVVGTVTGNKKLAMIGGIMGLAGGLAGGLGGAGEAAEMAAVDASMAGTGVDAATLGAAVPGQTLGAGQTSPDLTNFEGGRMSTDAVSSAAPVAEDFSGIGVDVPEEPPLDIASTSEAAPTDAELTGKSTYETNTENAYQAKSTAVDEANQQVNQQTGLNAPDDNVGLLGKPQQTTVTDAAGNTQQLVLDPAGSGVSGYIDKFGKWVKANKDMAKMGVDLVGGLLKGPSPQQQQIDLEKERYRRSQMMAQGKNPT